MNRIAFVRTAGIVLFAASSSGLPALADTSISGFVPTTTVPALTEVVAAYEKDHPGVSVHILPAGSKIIVDNLNRGLASDFVIFGDAFATKTTAITDTNHVFSERSILVVAPGAKTKITKPADLANGGVRIGWGSTGSNVELFENQTLENLSQQYGPDFASRVKANITIRRTDNDQLMKALDAGVIDAAFVFLSNTVGSDAEAIDLGDKAVTIPFIGGVVKTSAYATQAKDFLAFLRSPQGQAIMHKHKHGS